MKVKTLGGLVLFMLLQATASQAFQSMCTTYSPEEPPFSNALRCRKIGSTLFVDGQIDNYLYEEIKHWNSPYYYRRAQAKELKTISLNSRGGLMFSSSNHLEDSVDIMDIIEEKGINTQVLEGKVCKSACVPVFSAGKVRRAQAGALFMVHSPRFSVHALISLQKECGENLDALDCADKMAAYKSSQLEMMDRYFDLLEARGVSPSLREAYLSSPKDETEILKGNLIGLKDYQFNGAEALAFGLVDELI